MGRGSSPFGAAAEAQTPPASVPQLVSDSSPVRQLLERRLAQQRALAQFARRAMSAPAFGPLLAEGADLVRRFPALSGVSGPGTDEEDLAFFEAVSDVLETASGTLRDGEVSRHAALHDPLTGLANRSLIIDHLSTALARADRRSTLTAVIFLDLNHFKHINDTLGHVAGDELLVRVAERLGTTVRPADTLGRWGGDEFVVVCDDLEEPADVPAIVERIAAAFELPFHVHNAELGVGASIGVALSAGTDDPGTLIAAADSAMYQVKRQHDHGALRRAGREVPVLPAGFLPPKQERLTLRLLELLSNMGDHDTPAAEDREAVASG